MNIEKCKTLLKVLETGSLSYAAEELGYTASGISRIMASLEADVGFTLLVRSREGVKATKECLRLLPEIQKLVYQDKVCMELSKAITGTNTGEVIIGNAYSKFYPVIKDIIDEFRKEYPGITFGFKSGSSASLLRELKSHRIDICIISFRNSSDIVFHELFKDDLVVLLPSDSHLLKSAPLAIPVSVFTTEPYINILPDTETDNKLMFEKLGIDPNTKMEAYDVYSAFAMVESGFGIALNNRINCIYKSEHVAVMPLSPKQQVQIGIAGNKDMSPATAKFYEFLKTKEKNFK